MTEKQDGLEWLIIIAMIVWAVAMANIVALVIREAFKRHDALRRKYEDRDTD